MITLDNVTKRYGSICAVDDISFHINKGEIVGLLGQNGAGKSTTMNMITGYISRTMGSITIGGLDVLQDPKKVRQMIGYLPEQPPLYMDMKVSEYLKFVCELKNVPHKEISSQVDKAIETTQLESVKDRIISNLSKGYKQRVGLAQTLCGNPKIIILDEPTVGLDPNQIVEIRQTIKQLGKSHTVILSSHILHDVADVCKRIIIIDKGKVIADDSIENLTRSTSQNEMIIRTQGEPLSVLNILNSINGCTTKLDRNINALTNEYIISSDVDRDFNLDLIKTLSQNNLPLLMLKPMSNSLEDTFLRLTNQGKGV